MSQTVPKRPETVVVSAVLVEATPGRSARNLPSVSDSVVVIAEGFQSEDRTSSECGPLREAGSVLHERADFAGGVAAVATSPVVLAEDNTDGVMLPTVAGAAPLADFAEVVAADATSLADAGILFPADPAGVVTVGVAPLADAGPVTMAVADLTDAGILFPADPAGVVTVGVAPLADAGMVTVGVTDLADAKAASLTDAGILFPAYPAGIVTMGVTPLTDAGAASLADPAGNDAGGVMDLTVLDPVGTVVLPLLQGCVVRNCDVVDDPEYAGIWCQEIRNDSGRQYVSYGAVFRSVWTAMCRPTVIIAHPRRGVVV